MPVTRGRLADGREIVYYDAAAGRPKVLDDPRDLPETATAAEIRYDVLLDEWVAVASHRQTRTFLPPGDQCPLCPSTPERQTEIPSPDYEVVVFENRFPSFAAGAPAVSAAITGERADGADGPGVDGRDAGSLGRTAGGPESEQEDLLFRRRAGWGRCEVVCFSPEHDSSFSSLTPQQVGLVMAAWIDRTEQLSVMPHVEQVFPFENRGQAIGVTLSHPHGQIYAYPFVTPRTRMMLESARRHRRRTFRNLFADVLAAERRAGLRLVAENECWTAFVPAAARWPVEVHVYPRRQVPDLPALSEQERARFGPLYLEVLRRLDGLYGIPLPYVAGWHQAPVRADRDLAYLHLEVFSIQRTADRLKFLAGSESGMGVFVNDVTPEQAARQLREVVL